MVELWEGKEFVTVTCDVTGFQPFQLPPVICPHDSLSMLPNELEALHSGGPHRLPLRLPPEILIGIIDEAANGLPTLPTMEMWPSVRNAWLRSKAYPCERLINFMLVSFLWHETIITAPQLWARMRLDSSQNMKELVATRELHLLKYCLARSGEHRLNMTLAGSSGTHRDLFLPSLLESCKRWQALTVHSTFQQELFKESVEMPQLEILHLPFGLPTALQMKAEALRTIILEEGDQVTDWDLSALQQSLARYPHITSLLCRGILLLSEVEEAELDVLWPKVSNFSQLPNLVKLKMTMCAVVFNDTRFEVDVLRACPALTEFTTGFDTVATYGPYWGTLASPVKRLEIRPYLKNLDEDTLKPPRKLITMLRSFPLVETICWRDEFPRFSDSLEVLIYALSSTPLQSVPLAPQLRHLEFKKVRIDCARLFALCRERSLPKLGGGSPDALSMRITIREGCVYKDNDGAIPQVECMRWFELEKMCAIH